VMSVVALSQSKDRTDGTNDRFCEDLQRIFCVIRNCHIKILLGDF
jgi:hypothetical protein